MITLTQSFDALQDAPKEACYPDSRLEELCLRLTGDGITEAATLRAMALRDQLTREGTARLFAGRLTVTYNPTKKES